MSESVAETVTTAAATAAAAAINKSVNNMPVKLARDSLLPWMSDDVLALVSPVVSYWLFSLMFLGLDHLKAADKYRIHTIEEAEKRNRASKFHVLTHVLFQHLLQTFFGFALITYLDSNGVQHESANPWFIALPISLAKITAAFMIVDTWQYWLHRLMHYNKKLYKYLHSVHHELYVPYAFGALFNSPAEGFILDTFGTGIAMLITNLSAREQIILYNFATMKTVDDHCGYVLPYDPFQVCFNNNSIYHDIHHQPFGLKYNFAQPFFVFWDNLLGSSFREFNVLDSSAHLPKEQRSFGKNRLDINKYKEFLKNRRAARKDLSDVDAYKIEAGIAGEAKKIN